LLKPSKNSDSEALDCEFKAVGGEYNGRKFWGLFTVGGVTDGQAQAGEISRTKLCAILESARGIRPNDTSEAAKLARQTNGYADFNGLTFIAKIGIERGQQKPDSTGNFPDKNFLLEAITPDRREWRPVDQAAKQSATAPAPASVAAKPEAAQISRPQWAK
jgi:hypothetical protein